MFILLPKYKSKISLSLFFVFIITSCVKKHQHDSENKYLLPENKMVAILTDVFMMEAYVSEKIPLTNADSLTIVKKSLYAPILRQHKVDSLDFYSTFNYYQAHPKEFINLLSLVDSSLLKIVPLDSTEVKQLVEPPVDIDKLGSYTAQEAAMRDIYLKRNQNIKQKRKDLKNNPR